MNLSTTSGFHSLCVDYISVELSCNDEFVVIEKRVFSFNPNQDGGWAKRSHLPVFPL